VHFGALVGVASFRKDEDVAKRKNEMKNCLHGVLKDAVAHMSLAKTLYNYEFVYFSHVT
jgi:hypothetical protein